MLGQNKQVHFYSGLR